MLKTTRQQTVTAMQTAALDEEGGAVMLSLSDGDGHVFRQALDAHDVGRLLDVCRSILAEPVFVCDGDLEARRTPDDRGLTLKWSHEGVFGLVHLTGGETILFREALKSYCRLLMRSQKELPWRIP